MKYISFILMLIGGFLSFNSYALDYVLPPVTIGTIYHDATVDSNGYFNTTWYGVPYICFDCVFNDDGKTASGTWYRNDGSYDVPFPDKKPTIDPDKDQPDIKPDAPDIKPSVPDVKPPEPDKPTPPSGSYLSQVLSDISHLTPAMLYSSFSFHYDFSSSLEDNKRVAQAFLQKLSNVTPPDYASVNRIRDMMNDWQKTYSYMRPSDSGPYFLWNSSKFVSGEHRYTGSIIIAVYNCAKPNIYGDCYDLNKPLDINDPNYASLNDYKNGITRCMRNPNDPSCHSSGDSSGGSGDSSGDHSVTTCNPGYHPDISRPGVCVSDNSGGGTVPGGGEKPDNCPPPSYHKPGTMEGSCTTDLNPNPGDGGGSGSGNTDNNDNGDVVAAINALHADVNKNHNETIDTITDLPQETPDLIEGYLSPKINSIIDDMKKEMTDDYNDALSEFKGVFGDIDSYIPDIKLSFELPVQFTSGIRGRCVPLVFDFNIALVGFQPYHFHAEGVQACQLYDKYIRSIVEYMLYFLTALACRRVFTRAAEFVTSQS